MLSNYGIGGNEVKKDANEAIFEIPQNKTIVAQKLSASPPLKPELVEGLKTVEQVFEHFKPKINMSFQDAEGGLRTESLDFRNLGDFGTKGITAQSEFLSQLDIEKDQYKEIIRQLKANKILKSALDDPEAKTALIQTIRSLVEELKAAK